jgi:hypothetical protein
MGSATMDINFTHTVRYLGDDVTPVLAVAQSLLAVDGALRPVPKVLERLHPGLTINSIEIRIHRLLQDSPLREEFNGTLSTKFQASIEDVVEGVGRMTGLDCLVKHKRAISGLVILLLIVGALYVWNKQADRASAPPLMGDYNTVIALVSDDLGRTPEQIEAALEKVLSERDRRSLARDAANFAAPARKGGGVEIEGVVSFGEGAILAIPDHQEIDVLEDEEFHQTKENIEIYIRATDLDRSRSGWAGLIDIDGTQRRVRMVIVPGIDLDDLKMKADAGPIRGDVDIFYKRDRRDEWYPYVMHLYRIHEPPSGGQAEANTADQADPADS